MTGCPYCQKARKALEELRAEASAYRAIAVDWIEETEQPTVAERYDYYHVPAIFAGERKLYEAQPGESYAEIKANVKRALESV